MTVYIDGKTGTRLADVDVTDPTGHGVQVIRSFDTLLEDVTVHDCLMSGIRDFATRTTMVRPRVLRNGRDGLAFNGDGILLQGRGHRLVEPELVGNGDSFDYEHGIYAVGLEYSIERPRCLGNAASGIKAGGGGAITGGEIAGSVRGLILDGAIDAAVRIRGMRVSALTWAIHLLSNANVDRFDVDEITYPYVAGGPLPRFNDSRTGRQYDLAGWRNATGLDMHSVLEELPAPVPTPTPTPTKPKPGRKPR
jgi:hypothetical protein